MKKFEFMLECIDKIFSVAVSGNFIIENYTNLNIQDFYKTIFDNYVSLSDLYDQTTSVKGLSSEEVDTRLMTFINVATEESLTLFLSSLEKIVKDQKIDYDVKGSFERHYGLP